MPIFGKKMVVWICFTYNTNQARLFEEGLSKQINRVEETPF
jgi:hypothetical protein